MKEATETNVDIIQARFRAGDNQSTINVELELVGRATGNSDPNSGSGGGSSTSGALGGTVIGDITSGVRDPNPRDPILIDNPV